MVSAPVPPEPSDISGILKEAGFPLSNYGLEAHEWQRATPGFTAWKTHQPDGVFIAVQYTRGDARQGSAYQRNVRARLDGCAAVLRAAGYAVGFRDRGEEPPWLLIPAVATEGDGS